jgi:hypothetical protein
MSDAELIARLRAYREHDEGSGGMASFEVDECIEAADRIEALEAKLAQAVEALDDLLEAITAEDRFGDRSLTITGSTANLKWLLDAEDTARATLAEIKGESHD